MDNALRPIELMLVEDNPGDVRLTREALRESKLSNNLQVSPDGASALEWLHKRKADALSLPDVILLDLNLPGKGGQEVLAEIKGDTALRRIPVVIVTSSEAEEDIVRSYDLHANCYVSKPLELDQFTRVVRSIESFWFTIVKLPSSGM